MISIGCRLLFRLSSQSFPSEEPTPPITFSQAFLENNNFTMLQGLISIINHYIRKIKAIDLIIECHFDVVISITIYFELIEMQKFVPSTRYKYFHILVVLIVCMTTCNNLYIYYVPNVVSHVEFLSFVLYINALINEEVFLSTLLSYVLIEMNVSFEPVVIPQLFLFVHWILERPRKLDIIGIRCLLLTVIFLLVTISEMLFFANVDIVFLIKSIFPSISTYTRSIEEKECILQPNYHLFLRFLVEIAKTVFFKLEEFEFPHILHYYFDSSHSFAFWQYFAYIILSIPLLFLLIKNRDIYNPETEETLKPLIYLSISFIAYYLSFYKAEQSVLMYIYYLFLMEFFHEKINLSSNFSKVKISQKPIKKIHLKSSKVTKKYCQETENSHASTPHLVADEFDDIYGNLKHMATIQSINEITLSQLNDRMLQENNNLLFSNEQSALSKAIDEYKLRFQNYIDTISLQNIGICLQLTGLISSYEISLDLISGRDTLSVKIGLELIWKATLLQSDQLFNKQLYNKGISLISFIELGFSMFLYAQNNNLVGYLTQSVNFGLLLFVYECCLFTLLSNE